MKTVTFTEAQFAAVQEQIEAALGSMIPWKYDRPEGADLVVAAESFITPAQLTRHNACLTAMGAHECTLHDPDEESQWAKPLIGALKVMLDAENA